MQCVYRYMCVLLLFILVIITCLISYNYTSKHRITKQSWSHKTETIQSTSVSKTNQLCRFHSCFDIFRCKASNKWDLKIYIYPYINYLSTSKKHIFPEQTYEFESIIDAVHQSQYVTSNISEACLFIPPIDLLAERDLNLKLVSAVLNSLPSWNSGSNHLFFNFFPLLPLPKSNLLNIQIGEAMVAGTNLKTSNNRQGFDVSIPLFNALTVVDPRTHSISYSNMRKWKLIISQLTIQDNYRGILRKVEDNHAEVLMLRKCLGSPLQSVQHKKLCKDGLQFNYPATLKDGTFCLILPGYYYGTTLLLDSLMMGCIPVIVMDDYILPFGDVLEWKRASIRLREYQLSNVYEILMKIDENEVINKRYQAFYLWEKYFSSIETIVDTIFKVFIERIFVTKKRTYEDWNGPLGNVIGQTFKPGVNSPLFLPLRPAVEKGFTAVILTYNRMDMLFVLMKEMDKVPSLSKLIIVWNNPYSNPHQNIWPILNKPWKLIQTKTNRLTNRFYPFKEIETDAVMAIDDDILMLTSDEIEFAYQTWCEFSDRLVGFPARVHITDPNGLINGKQMKYKYESEWQNELSMVLTGAAFYHKIYNHWFTYMLPVDMRNYIDEKMNCEDIAMNFLIANLTGKAPIKVSPRKRFKCAQCQGNDSLWSETSHFIKRSECLKVFTEYFGKMPLETVEYRVDPVLFQEIIPQEMKAFPNVGMV